MSFAPDPSFGNADHEEAFPFIAEREASAVAWRAKFTEADWRHRSPP
jgi:hypothetical protein